MPAEKTPSSLSHSRQNKYCVSPEPAIYRINLTLVRLCEIAWVQLRQKSMIKVTFFSSMAVRPDLVPLLKEWPIDCNGSFSCRAGFASINNDIWLGSSCTVFY